MNRPSIRILLASSLGILSIAAAAQTPPPYRLNCTSFGASPPEPLGDRAGHSLSIGQYTCRVEGGLMDGAVTTGSTVYEFDGDVGMGIAGNTVARKPGALVVAVNSTMKNTMQRADGKVTGVAGAGSGRYAVATGSAASLLGRTYTYTNHTTGPGQFVIEVKPD